MSWIVALSLFTPPALAADLDPLVQQCEDQWVAGQYEASIASCEARLKADPKDIEALWRKARSIYGKGEIMANQGASAATRIQMYGEVVALGERILAIQPGHGEGLHWYGTGLGRTATAKGVLSSLFMADDIEGAWLGATKSSYRYRAVDGSSSFPADSYYALGQFYRLCPDSSIVKLLTGTRGDIDKSVQWLRKAVADTPNRPEFAKELGVSLLCKAERDDDSAALAEGRQWLQKSLAMPGDKPTDKLDKQQIPVILSRADEACGYSRDGWQDVSEESLKKQAN